MQEGRHCGKISTQPPKKQQVLTAFCRKIIHVYEHTQVQQYLKKSWVPLAWRCMKWPSWTVSTIL